MFIMGVIIAIILAGIFTMALAYAISPIPLYELDEEESE